MFVAAVYQLHALDVGVEGREVDPVVAAELGVAGARPACFTHDHRPF